MGERAIVSSQENDKTHDWSHPPGDSKSKCKRCGIKRRWPMDICPAASLHDRDSEFRVVDEQMHKLWTWAVGLPGYDKKAWQALEEGIARLAKRGEVRSEIKAQCICG